MLTEEARRWITLGGIVRTVPPVRSTPPNETNETWNRVVVRSRGRTISPPGIIVPRLPAERETIQTGRGTVSFRGTPSTVPPVPYEPRLHISSGDSTHLDGFSSPCDPHDCLRFVSGILELWHVWGIGRRYSTSLTDCSQCDDGVPPYTPRTAPKITIARDDSFVGRKR